MVGMFVYNKSRLIVGSQATKNPLQQRHKFITPLMR
jgi:hypothetical protein